MENTIYISAGVNVFLPVLSAPFWVWRQWNETGLLFKLADDRLRGLGRLAFWAPGWPILTLPKYCKCRPDIELSIRALQRVRPVAGGATGASQALARSDGPCRVSRMGAFERGCRKAVRLPDASNFDSVSIDRFGSAAVSRHLASLSLR